MMIADENARIKHLRKLLAPWPEYDVLGNRPYAKGCYLIRRARVEKGQYLPPEIVYATERNYDMMLIMEHANFHPARAEQCAPKAVKSKAPGTGPRGGLLNMTIIPTDHRHTRRALCAKAVTLIEEGLELAALFVDKRTVEESTPGELVTTLKQVWRRWLKV